ncbi:uncharacterized protein LOC129946694 [Eupeodes corollae]|uniref:uncharacterized protein LOC129946694 n=1 Tax=Eupeodes corollae TaxID=290404 RepID=UPI00248FFC19|nr:uncharacterized protein LOC129946694 [Eupeodes corollae]
MPRSKWALEQVVFGGIVHLDEGLTTIGRNIRSTIVPPSDFVSRNHAQIHISPGGNDIRIVDLGSKNGIYVNKFHYCNVECALNVGDLIGIGAEVSEDAISIAGEGKYPIYILKCFPEEDINGIHEENSEKSSCEDNTPQSEQAVKSDEQNANRNDDKNDRINENDNFVIPQAISEAEEVEVVVKKEPEPVATTSSSIICENIKSIFGDLNSELLSTLSEETRKIAETATRMGKPILCEGVICISSSEDEDDCGTTNVTDKRQNQVISPQLFNDSANSDKDNRDKQPEETNALALDANPNSLNKNQTDVQKPQQINSGDIAKSIPPECPSTSPSETDKIAPDLQKQTTAEQNNNEPILEPEIKNLKDELDDEEDDLFFTQKIFEDMKEYAADLINEESPEFKTEPEDLDSIPTIKQEICPQNLDGTIINLDDEDDFDEALESKVHDWSMKLTRSSQSFSNSFNVSQVYEDNYSDEEVTLRTRPIFIDDDDEDEMDFVERAALVEVKTEPDSCKTDEEKSCQTGKLSERNLQKTLFSSSEEDTDHQDQPSTSSDSLKKFHKKIVRRLSTSENIPNKKPRLSINSRSDNTNEEHVHIRRPSSSHRTYLSKSSGSKHSHSSHSRENSSSKDDVFDKLKENDKSKQDRKSSSSLSSHKNSSENKSKSKDRGPSVHHSNSCIELPTSPTSNLYKSASVARMKSVESLSLVEQNHIDDFVEIKKATKVVEESKKPETQAPVATTTISKIIRGPPEIIQPPTLPVNKGKLRGISATHNRIAEKLKASSNTKELKRKWLEKPSAKKDKERAKAIQEDRKKKLKELNDRKQSENLNSASISTKEKTSTDDKEGDTRKKVKVKLTKTNRGAFLTELPATNLKPHYVIPKKIPKPNGTSPKLSNGSSKPSSKISPTQVVKNKKLPQKPSTEIVSSFAQELAQADTVVLQRQTSRDRTRSTDSANETQRQCAPPRRNSKKINFASMQQHFEENNRILIQASCLRSPASNTVRPRKVTFKLPPEIRYFESVSSAKPKRQQKESSTFMERRAIIRKQYSILDKTDSLLDDILSWSQLWLRNKHHNVNMMVFPMTNNFKSFGEYKNIILPLLKMEYLAHLEKAMEQSALKTAILAEIDYSAPHKHRDYVFAKCNTILRPTELSYNDLALIDVFVGSTTIQYFGYISNIRKSGTYTFITFEITPNAIPKDILTTKPKIKIRRIIDGILLHLSTFNAVHQLEQTPLIQKILNPSELQSKQNNLRTSCIEYKGFNALNKEQHDILLKTYEKAIDESSPNISLINGPPGTGKSVLISNLAIQLLYGNEVKELDKKILICAQSNMAVDVIAEKLIKIKQKLSLDVTHFNVVRFGMDEKVHPNVKTITLKSVLQRHRMSILKKQANQGNDQIMNEENLNSEIVQLEAQIVEMEKHNFQDVRQEELMEMRRNLTIKKNIVNQVFRPEDEKRLSKWFLQNANIVCSTLSSCVKLASFVDYFDVCIIDEATQCTEPWALMPLRFGVSNLIMVGDTQQLPATVISQRAKELGLETSLFTRIKKCLESDYRETPNILEIQNKPIYTLHEQYRMHSEISKWPNMYFYKNQLRNNPKVDEFKSSIKPFSILNLEYRQNDSYYGQISISNNLEAEFVAKLVTELNNYIPNKFYSYGIITPYAQHREKLENMIRNSGLNDIMVNTIDSYQGIEKDVIIISNARTHGVGFLGNYQRLNVALTRPRKCLIVCGNFKNLESVPSWASLLANAKDRGLYHNISTKDALDINKNVIEKIKIKR